MNYILNSLINKFYIYRLNRKSNVSIGKKVYISPASIIMAKETVIGDYTRINGPIFIKGEEKVIIGMDLSHW